MTENRSVVEVISRPWGFEKIVINTDKYCGKFLYVVKGKSTQMHYHKVKDKTIFVHSGKVRMLYNSTVEHMTPPTTTTLSVTLNPGDNFRVTPQMIHQVFAIEDAQIYEFSTSHEDGDLINI